MSDFRKLKVWRKAHALGLNVHRVAVGINRARHSSLRAQMVRAAFSVPTNIVEGCCQDSRKDFARFILIALNSATELEYPLMAARDVGAISQNEFRSLADQTVEVRRMLYGLRNTVLATPKLPRRPVPTL